MWLAFLMTWLPYLAAASIYPAVSIYLLKRPLKRFQHTVRLHPRTNQPLLQVRTSSHRGGAAEAPENTIAAFDHSAKLGIDLFELDVHLTKDKQVVVYHDHTVDRLAPDGISGLVMEFTLDDLPDIELSAPLPPPFHPAGARLEYELSHEVTLEDATRPPLLEDLFKCYPEQCMNIDVKDFDEELVEKTAKLIEKYQREQITIWGSGKDENAQRMYARNPNIPLFFSAKQLGLLYLKFLTGVLPFMHIKETAIEIPLFTPQLLERMKGHGTAITQTAGWKGYLTQFFLGCYQHLSTSPALIQHLHARNIQVIYWVLNEEKEFEYAYNCGADGVMTDVPSKLVEYVKRRDATRQGDSRSNSTSRKQQ